MTFNTWISCVIDYVSGFLPTPSGPSSKWQDPCERGDEVNQSEDEVVSDIDEYEQVTLYPDPPANQHTLIRTATWKFLSSSKCTYHHHILLIQYFPSSTLFFGDDSDGGVCGNHAAGGNIVAIAADNVLTTP